MQMEANGNPVGFSFPAIATRYAPKLLARPCRDKPSVGKNNFDSEKSVIRYTMRIFRLTNNSTRSAGLDPGWGRRFNPGVAVAVLSRIENAIKT
jgi:hypothetical protein